MAGRELEPQERLDWLRLSRSEGVGPVTFYALLRRFGSAAAALAALPHSRAPATPASRGRRPRASSRLERLGGRLVCWGEPLYPPALAAIEDAPPVLTVLGRAELLRRAHRRGGRRAQRFGQRPPPRPRLAAGLAEAGIVVASGMARGIDAAAHIGALDRARSRLSPAAPTSSTPRRTAGFTSAHRADGAVVAELPLGSEPQARHFPRRNRIISGMSLGVVVVEAAAKSGSLITARFALEQGREVFAVPGSPLDPRCRGCNDLLRNGATLTETAADILDPARAAAAGPAAARAPAPAQPRLPLPPRSRPARRPAAGRSSTPRRRARPDRRAAGADAGRG